MKSVITIITTVLFLTFAGCTDFSTSYQNIDEGEFRALSFMFSNATVIPAWHSTTLADVAPGDSVMLVAVFAGKKKDLYNDIDWRVSFNVAVNNYGRETAIGSEPIDKHGRIIDFSFSQNTQAIAFKFKVPEDIVRKSASIPEKWTDMLPLHIRSVIPKEITSMTKNQVIDLIEEHEKQMRQNGDYTTLGFDTKFLPALFQLFTVPVIITADIKNEGREHKIQTSHSVRYNSRFHSFPYPYGIPVNHNSVIYEDDIILYKVKGSNITSFDYKSGKQYESFLLRTWRINEIYVEDGYSYFLDRFSNSFDATFTMDAILSGSMYKTTEAQYSYWQFQLDENEKKNVPFSKQMDIDNTHGRLILPKDRSIKNFTLWITVRDEVINEKLRPRGSAFGEFQMRFVYTPESQTILTPDRVIP